MTRPKRSMWENTEISMALNQRTDAAGNVFYMVDPDLDMDLAFNLRDVHIQVFPGDGNGAVARLTITRNRDSG